jgi:hypothetical protein
VTVSDRIVLDQRFETPAPPGRVRASDAGSEPQADDADHEAAGHIPAAAYVS